MTPKNSAAVATIRLRGHRWRVLSETPTKLVLTRETAQDVRSWRKRKRFTQREAADLLGISQGQLARIENGTRTCPPDVLERIGK